MEKQVRESSGDLLNCSNIVNYSYQSLTWVEQKIELMVIEVIIVGGR